MHSFFFHRRKLLNDSDEDPIIKLCEPYCDQIISQDGSCPYQCLTHCYPICNHPILFDPPPPPPPIFIAYDDNQQVSKSHKLNLFFTLSLAVLAATFLICAVYTAYKFYKGRYLPWRNRSLPPPPPTAGTQNQDEIPIVREYFLDQDIGSMVDHPIWYIRTVGLPPTIISSIPTCKYKRSDGLVEGTECSVCLSEFQEDEILRILPKCDHAFHISCIDTWLRSHINCPLCRALIVISAAAAANSQSTLSSIVESQILENRVSDATDVETEENPPQLSIHVDDVDDSESPVENNDVRSSVHLIRRSVSLDCLAASAISVAIDRDLDKHLDQISSESSSLKGIDSSEKVSNSVCSSSNETSSMPKGPSIMVKRSLSCSAKVFLSRYSKGRSSAPPPAPAP